MQQPPLSQQIKAIERELDVQLFRRKARGVELTDAGMAFLEDARAILAHLDRAFETTRRTARGEQGRLCVGVTSTSPFHPLVPRAIRSFSEACPMVSLTLEECLSNELAERLRNERMDVASCGHRWPTRTALSSTPLLEEPMVVALPGTHSLAKGERNATIPLKRLAGETFLLYGPPGTGMYDAIIAACHARRIQSACRKSRCVDPAGASHHIDPEPGRRGAGHHVCPGFAPRYEHAWRRIPTHQGHRSTEGRAQSCDPARDSSAIVRQFCSLSARRRRLGGRNVGRHVDAARFHHHRVDQAVDALDVLRAESEVS